MKIYICCVVALKKEIRRRINTYFTQSYHMQDPLNTHFKTLT